MEFFKLFTRKNDKSKNVAKERLKLVLVHDRADFSPRLLERIKEDIVNIISQYADIDEDGLDVKLTRMRKDDTTVSALVANIPITKVK